MSGLGENRVSMYMENLSPGSPSTWRTCSHPTLKFWTLRNKAHKASSNILIWAKCFPCCLKGFLFSKTCLKGCAQPPQFIGKSIIPCTNKKWTSFYSRKKCTALCLMSFDGFSALFALFTWKVEQFTVKMDHFLASQWLFGFSHQTTFWVFWFTQTNLIVFFIRRPPSLRSLKAASWKKQSDSFFVHQKTQKVVWFENPNSHCSARKWSIFTVHCSTFQVHSANKAENPSKLIAHRAVHFSRSCQLVPFLFFHGNILFKQLSGCVQRSLQRGGRGCFGFATICNEGGGGVLGLQRPHYLFLKWSGLFLISLQLQTTLNVLFCCTNFPVLATITSIYVNFCQAYSYF